MFLAPVKNTLNSGFFVLYMQGVFLTGPNKNLRYGAVPTPKILNWSPNKKIILSKMLNQLLLGGGPVFSTRCNIPKYTHRDF